MYCVTADEKVEDSDDVLKALEAVVDRKQCVHVRISACLCNTLYVCYRCVHVCMCTYDVRVEYGVSESTSRNGCLL